QRIYPAIDIFLSGTRREELLLQPWELEKINLIRRGLAGHKPEEAIQRLLMFVKKFPTNTEMLKGIPGRSVRRRLPVFKAIGHGSQFAVRTRRFSKIFYRKVLGRKRPREISELSTSRIHDAVLRAIATGPAMQSSGDHLDVGSGTGELLRLVRARYPFRSFGCDYTDKLLSVPGP